MGSLNTIFADHAGAFRVRVREGFARQSRTPHKSLLGSSRRSPYTRQQGFHINLDGIRRNAPNTFFDGCPLTSAMCHGGFHARRPLQPKVERDIPVLVLVAAFLIVSAKARDLIAQV